MSTKWVVSTCGYGCDSLEEMDDVDIEKMYEDRDRGVTEVGYKLYSIDDGDKIMMYVADTKQEAEDFLDGLTFIRTKEAQQACDSFDRLLVFSRAVTGYAKQFILPRELAYLGQNKK